MGKTDPTGGSIVSIGTGASEPVRKRTGPRTAHGKRRSSRNATKHGIFAKVALIKGEAQAEFGSLLRGLQDTLKPVGALEHLLVEKLAVLSWRYRRMVIAEGAEIAKSVDFYQWDRDLDREHSLERSVPTAKFARGMISHFRTPGAIERCLLLLADLRAAVELRGFDLEADYNLLATLYGTDVENPPQHSLLRTYAGAASQSKPAHQGGTQQDRSKARGDDDGTNGGFSAANCRRIFLRKVDEQIRWLEDCRKQFGAVETDRTKLALLTRQIPDAATSERLLRYEAALDRSFERALSQLERLQRMRLGMATLPPVRVELSG